MFATVTVLMGSLISNQCVYSDWDWITSQSFHQATPQLMLDYNQCPVIQSLFFGKSHWGPGLDESTIIILIIKLFFCIRVEKLSGFKGMIND